MSSEVEDHSGCQSALDAAEEQFHAACERAGDLQAHLDVATEALDVAVAANGDLETQLYHVRAERDDALELAECHRNDYRQADADRRDAETRILDLGDGLREARSQADGLRQRAEDAERLLLTAQELVNRQLSMLEVNSRHVSRLIAACGEADGRLFFGRRVSTRDIYDILINRSDDLHGAWRVKP